MKMHPLGVISVCAVALAVGVAVAPWAGWIVASATVGVAALFMASTRCRHRHATLQPPVHNGGPDRDHARWYCDRCGATWPAGFAAETKPRLIYGGYDEHKAIRSAARADTLEKERRRVAGKRAGWSNGSPQAQSNGRPSTRNLEVVRLRRVHE